MTQLILPEGQPRIGVVSLCADTAMLFGMNRPNLADPEFDPSDEELAELVRRAFAGVADAHTESLRVLHERIAKEGAEARRRWLERKSCDPS